MAKRVEPSSARCLRRSEIFVLFDEEMFDVFKGAPKTSLLEENSEN
jgi:hypothetical protein